MTNSTIEPPEFTTLVSNNITLMNVKGSIEFPNTSSFKVEVEKVLNESLDLQVGAIIIFKLNFIEPQPFHYKKSLTN